jgi:hypothetical protein
MNVSKGDKAIVISGAAMGAIVEVGEYIEPLVPFKQDNGKWAMVLEHSHWCKALGSPIPVHTDISMYTPDLKEIGVLATRTDVMDVAPLEDSVLRKLVDVDETTLIHDEVPA